MTKEEIDKMSQEEVSSLLKQKRRACKTCAQEAEMLYYDHEYHLLRDRISEILAENAAKKKELKK